MMLEPAAGIPPGEASRLWFTPLNCNQLIEAGAGAGKTYAITNLYIRLLLGRDTGFSPLGVDQILALTFTRAATAELKRRVRRRIDEARQALRQGDDEDPFLAMLAHRSADRNADLARLENASRLADEACIFTIHGFCGRVLDEQSFDTGSLFRQERRDQDEALFREAAADCFRATISALDGPRKQVAAGFWQTPEQLAAGMRPYAFLEDLMLTPAARVTDDELNALQEDMRACKRTWLQEHFKDRLAGAGLKKSTKPYKYLAAMDDFCRDEQDAGVFNPLWETYRRAALEGALGKGGVLPDHPLLERLDSVWTRLQAVREALKADLWRLALDDVRARLRAVKRRRRLLTSDDLLVELRDALRRSPRSDAGESQLGAALAQRWPMAMIDEFQDTDNVQYEILSAIYPAGAPGDRGLLMIGDPKQSIYQFRGADVYTYLNARREIIAADMERLKQELDLGSLDQEADFKACIHGWSKVDTRLHFLHENHRSSPQLVRALNRLFSTAGLFDHNDRIAFHPARPVREHRAMFIDDKEVAPLLFFTVGEPGLSANKDILEDAAVEYAAAQTAQLLRLADEGRVRLADRHDGADGALEAGEIAFLVKSWDHAGKIRRALARRNIPSVCLARENVLHQPVANDLVYVLEAALDPANERAVRNALAVRLLQCEAGEIERLEQDSRCLRETLQEFQEYHDAWAQDGIAAMLNRLLQKRRIAQKWLRTRNGERELTDFRHLSELLQEGEQEAPGMRRLLHWFIREKQEDGDAEERRQLRLENDENLVKIVTMHAAKGMEYDVVMIPMPAFQPRQVKGGQPAVHHAHGAGGGPYQACLEVGDNEEHRERARRERAAEDLRLLYVAMTRARYRCCVGLPLKEEKQHKLLSGSACARMLGLAGSPKRREILAEGLALRLRENLRELPRPPLPAVLEAVREKWDAWREAAGLRPAPLVDLPDPDWPFLGGHPFQGERPRPLYNLVNADAEEQQALPYQSPQPPAPLAPPRPLPEIDRSRRRHSYSSMSAWMRDREQEAADDERADDAGAAAETTAGNDREGPAPGDDAAAGGEAFSRFTFPRGPRVGLALHGMLEDLDPAADAAVRRTAANAALDRLGLTSRRRWGAVLAQWLDDMLETPLHPLETTLEQVGKQDRLCEVEFHFPVKNFAPAVQKMRQAGYLESFDPGPDFQPAGMMTGLIDLAFRHDGKYYVLDYKSNHLGPSFEDYAADRLQREIERFHYDLQYLVYTAALHRWLKARSRDYDCEQHLGGVFYLFLRGMEGKRGGDNGIYFHRLPASLVEELDGLLGGGPGAEPSGGPAAGQ